MTALEAMNYWRQKWHDDFAAAKVAPAVDVAKLRELILRKRRDHRQKCRIIKSLNNLDNRCKWCRDVDALLPPEET